MCVQACAALVEKEGWTNVVWEIHGRICLTHLFSWPFPFLSFPFLSFLFLVFLRVFKGLSSMGSPAVWLPVASLAPCFAAQPQTG